MTGHGGRMRAIGIDPSKKSTGWAVVEEVDGGYVLIESGRGPVGEPLVLAMRNAILDHEPDVAAVELPYFRYPQSAIAVAIAAGVAIGQLLDLGIPHEPVLPSVWRLGVFGPRRKGKRAELKQQSIVRAYELFDKIMPEDEAEAALVAVWALKEQHV